MDDVLSENVRDLHSRVTETGNGIAERVHAATVATGAAVDQAGDVARQALSQAGDVAEDVVDAGRRATRSASRQIQENPLSAVLFGVAFACIAGLWLRRGGPTAKAPSRRKSRVTTPTKKAGPQ
jgi:hypothetical protein